MAHHARGSLRVEPEQPEPKPWGDLTGLGVLGTTHVGCGPEWLNGLMGLLRREAWLLMIDRPQLGEMVRFEFETC